MRARAFCAHPSTCDHWALRCMSQMSRSGGQSEAKPPVLKYPKLSLVLIYRPTAVDMKGLLLAYIDDTTIQYPTSESVDRRTNDIVIMESVLVVAVNRRSCVK
ncbi:hypothetical protein TNCV_1929591 [Trichonephila clavipes]|nr:hypothetical protein TNCV_1929591 [Trichonephila clavipes]